MLPTFVLALREGLEAALIVSIIATFLRRNSISLRPMWIGVGVAVALAAAVGIVLRVVEQSLPQRQQEGLETVIGAIAVFFVTAMIVWMRSHARFMKRDLEVAAESAIGDGTARAMALMAFIAVLREGFETAVLLLGTFNVATSTLSPAIGAVLGLVVAVGIGIGIYSGGVRLNLARFFTVTSVFLVFVAAGLVLGALRTGHEAGWINVGQARTIDLSWLAPNGAIQTALISGVLGIPADPRAIELLGWLCYLIPVLVLVLWPQRLRPAPRIVPRIRLGLAAGLAALAVVLLVSVRLPSYAVPTTAPLEDGGTASVAVHGSTADLTVTAEDGNSTTVALADPGPSASGIGDTTWHLADGDLSDLPTTLDAATLLTYTGNRNPVGLDIARAPGPYDATWREKGTVTVETLDGGLVDGTAEASLLLTISGGGLTSPRVISVEQPGSAQSWRVQADHISQTTSAFRDQQVARDDRLLWKLWFPVALLVAAAVLVLRTLTSRRTDDAPTTSVPTEPVAQPALTHSAER